MDASDPRHHRSGRFRVLGGRDRLIIPLGYEVLATALEQAGRLEARFPDFDGLNVGVNVSGRQFADPAFAERTLELIDASAVPVEKVVLELTESVLRRPPGLRRPVAAPLAGRWGFSSRSTTSARATRR